MVHLPTLSSNPQGSGSLPRLTSSQGEHKRSPFSWNTHLPGTGHSLALPTLPTQPLSHCLGTDSGPTYPPIRLQVWSDTAEVAPGRPDPPGDCRIPWVRGSLTGMRWTSSAHPLSRWANLSITVEHLLCAGTNHIPALVALTSWWVEAANMTSG